MRLALLYSPRLLCERLALESVRRRRLGVLKNTVARHLKLGHIDSLELLELARSEGINVIYDVGANIGTWTLLAKAMFPESTVEAFEPLAAHHEGFKKNCEDLPGVAFHRIALGPENATLSMRVTSFSDASSLLPITSASARHFGVTEVDQVPVPVRRLDEYRAEKNLPPPDLIKLDVQGFELAVLSGGISVLAHARALIVEVSFVELYQNQCTFPEICTFLEAHKFRVRAMGVTTPLGAPLVQADILFLRS